MKEDKRQSPCVRCKWNDNCTVHHCVPWRRWFAREWGRVRRETMRLVDQQRVRNIGSQE